LMTSVIGTASRVPPKIKAANNKSLIVIFVCGVHLTTIEQ